MPELRQDPITSLRVVIVEDRARRPDLFTRSNCDEALPAHFTMELMKSADYWDENGRRVLCAMIEQEIDDGRRLVELTKNYLAYVPASGHPFETWVIPIKHSPLFENASNADMLKAASIIRSSLKRYSCGLGDPPYNMYLHTSPPGYDKLNSYHWHFVCIPKLTTPAGFEMSTNMLINVTIPEDAADYLRSAQVC